jgi:tRNA U34 2-thiouridine synthase MnmA/TrmU
MKAIALFSGGLDSALAIKLLTHQEIEVVACNINTLSRLKNKKIDVFRALLAKIIKTDA